MVSGLAITHVPLLLQGSLMVGSTGFPLRRQRECRFDHFERGSREPDMPNKIRREVRDMRDMDGLNLHFA